MSIANEISRLQTAKADLKTAIEAKGVTVPSSATIDTYDYYVSQISGGGGLSRTVSGTPYCNGLDLVVGVQTEISIDGGTSWVNSGSPSVVIVESGASQCAPPYDAEIEYLQSSGTQYINTSLYLNTSNFEIGYNILGNQLKWGYTHQGSGQGTWILVEPSNAFFGSYSSGKISISTNPTENVIKYESTNGITVNGNFHSKTFSIGSDSISSIPLYIFAQYDFKNGMDYGSTKLKSFYLKNNGELVLDMIPVRVGQVGYMYDKVSGQLFGNDGTGDFILGADK